MDQKELEEISLSVSDRIEKALKAGDVDGALKLGGKLFAREFSGLRKGQTNLIQFMTNYLGEYFTREQDSLARQVEEAIRDGDTDKALKLLEQKREQWRVLHDLYIDTIARTWHYPLHFGGDRDFEELLEKVAEAVKGGIEAWEAESPESFAKTSARVFWSNTGKLTVTEDDEKYIFTMQYCGSGHRLMREGWYDPPKSYTRIKGPRPMTGQRESLPFYCAHCFILDGQVPIDLYGHPQRVFFPPKNPDDPCIMHVYKDKSGAPEEYYKLLGRKKPADKSTIGKIK